MKEKMEETSLNEKLYRACHQGNLAEVKDLIAAGADPLWVNEFEWTQLSSMFNGIPGDQAKSWGLEVNPDRVEIALLLMERGADILQVPQHTYKYVLNILYGIEMGKRLAQAEKSD